MERKFDITIPADVENIRKSILYQIDSCLRENIPSSGRVNVVIDVIIDRPVACPSHRSHVGKIEIKKT